MLNLFTPLPAEFCSLGTILKAYGERAASGMREAELREFDQLLTNIEEESNA